MNWQQWAFDFFFGAMASGPMWYQLGRYMQSRAFLRETERMREENHVAWQKLQAEWKALGLDPIERRDVN